MIISFLLSFVAPFVAAFAVIQWAFAGYRKLDSLRSLIAILASGLGLGFASCTFFLWRAFSGSSAAVFEIAESLLLLVCAAVFLLLSKRESSKRKSYFSSSYKGEPSNTRTSQFLSVSFIIVLFFAAIAFVILSINRPHGSGDAFAIWNLHARFLFRGGSHWADYFSPLLGWSHPDYPLFVPATIARFWTYIGTETTLVPQIVAGLFTFGTVGLILSTFIALQAKSRGLLAAMFLLGTGYLMRLGSSQYADVPLGFFILSTVMLLALKDQASNENYRLVALAGMMSALAAWTKNEGFLFILAVALSRLTVALLTPGQIKRYFKEMLFFSLGLIPVMTIIVFFKLKFAPPNDLVLSQAANLLILKLGDASRYFHVAKVFLREMLHFGNALIAVLGICLLIFRIEVNKVNTRILVGVGTTVTAMLLGYFFVYIVTPYDLDWHLGTSLERLLMQLWPTFLFLVFFMTKPLSDQ